MQYINKARDPWTLEVLSPPSERSEQAAAADDSMWPSEKIDIMSAFVDCDI
jgi:hypothetical protein